MLDPSSAEEWLDVARERGLDAHAMLPERQASVGPGYMAGYAIEAALKALLQKRGIPRPPNGPEGHDMRALWKASGMQLRDLKDTDGSAAFFVNDWTTSLRYQAEMPAGPPDAQALVQTARRLVGELTKRVKRTR